MDFAAEMLGGQAVAELVDDLHDGQADPEAGMMVHQLKKLWKSGSLS